MMKKIFALVFILVLGKMSYSQGYPISQNLGSDSTIVISKGALQSRLAPIVISDTTAANNQRIKNYPGAQLYTANGDFYVRNATATKWVLVSSGSSGPINIYNSDGTLTGNRVLTGAGNSLTFNGISGLGVNKVADSVFTVEGGIHATGGLRLDNLASSPGTKALRINSQGVVSVADTTSIGSGFVPYVGATQNVNLGQFGLKTEYVEFDTTTRAVTDRTLSWSDADGTLNLGMTNGGSLTQKIGLQQFARVKNVDTVAISKGQAVYVFGASGDRASVKLATNKGDSTSSKVLGVAAENIPINDVGLVGTFGTISNLNLSAFTAGNILYLDSIPGELTVTKPQAPYHLVFVGVVERANAGNGLLFVNPQNGYELDELHNVRITSPVPNRAILTYDSVRSLWVDTTLNAIGGITGSGTSGQVAYFNGTNSITSSPTFAFTPTSQLLVNNSVTAASAIARGINATPTLTAAANNDVLVGLDINPTFNNGAFTGVSNWSARFQSADVQINGLNFGKGAGSGTNNVAIGTRFSSVYSANNSTGVGVGSLDVTTGGNNAAFGYAALLRNTTGTFNVGIGGVALQNNTTGGTNIALGYNAGSVNTTGSNNIFIGNWTTGVVNSNSNWTYIGNSTTTSTFIAGNLLLNTTTDANFRLDVNGTARVQGSTTITGSTTASASIARGINTTPTLVAAANNDVLVGLDINPTFTIGAFTGTNRIGLRVQDNRVVLTGTYTQNLSENLNPETLFLINTQINGRSNQAIQAVRIVPVIDGGNSGTQTHSALFVNPTFQNIGTATTYGINSPGNNLFGSSGASTVIAGSNVSFIGQGGAATNLNVTSPNSQGFRINVNTNAANFRTEIDGAGLADFRFLTAGNDRVRIFNNGNVFIGASPTDAGFRLDVNGTARVQGNFTQSGGTSAAFINGITLDGTRRLFGSNTITYQSNSTTTQHQFRNEISSALSGTIVSISNGSGEWGASNGNSFLNISGRAAIASGVQDLTSILISNSVENIGTYTGIIRGIYYNPSSIGGSGYTHRAIQTVSGDVLFGTTSGNVMIGTTTAGGRFTIQPTNDQVGMAISGSSLTGSNAQSLVSLSQTWNTTGNPTAFLLNITNTASGATADLMDLQVGGASRFEITAAGRARLGAYGSGTITGTSTYNLAVDASGNVIEVTGGGGGGIGGSGTTNRLAKFTASGTIGNSSIADSSSSVAMTISSGGNVGIGTSSPSSKFDLVSSTNGNVFSITGLGGLSANFIVQGNGEQTMRFYNNASTGSARTSIKFANRLNTDWNWIMYNDASETGANNFTLQNHTNGVAYHINTSNQIGIGTTTIGSRLQVNGNAAIGYSASTAAPTNGLAVAGNVGIGIAAPVTNFQVYKTTSGLSGMQVSSVTHGSTITDGLFVGVDDNNAYLYMYENLPLQLATNNVARVYINNDGTVFIGNSSAIASPNLGILSGTGGNGTNVAGAELRIRGGASTGNAAGGPITFYTSAAGSAGTGVNAATERMRIDQTNLSLSINTIRIKNGAANTSFVRAEENASTAAFTYLTMDGRSTGFLSFSTNDLERIRLTSGGSLGIGTTTPGSTLQVNGNAAIGYSASTAAPTNGLIVAGNAYFGGQIASLTDVMQLKGSGNVLIAMQSTVNTQFSGMNLYNEAGTLAASFALGNSNTGSFANNFFLGPRTATGNLLFVSGASGTTRMTMTTNGEFQFTPAANTSIISTTAAYSLTGANAQSLIDLAGTWNTTGNPTAIKLNITNTASGATADLMELQVGGVNQFAVGKTGSGYFKDMLTVEPQTANTGAIKTDGYSLTGSNAQALLSMTGTWNTTGNPTAIKLDITNTASGASAYLMDLQVGGTTQFRVAKDGAIRTTAPTGGTADNWKFGTKVASSVVFDDNDYLEVEVGGTLYRVALVNLAEPEPEAIPASTPEDRRINLPAKTSSQRIQELENEIQELKQMIKFLMPTSKNKK